MVQRTWTAKQSAQIGPRRFVVQILSRVPYQVRAWTKILTIESVAQTGRINLGPAYDPDFRYGSVVC